MATVTIKLRCKGRGVEWGKVEGTGVDWGKTPTASEGDVVRWECDEGPWFIVFKTGAGPLIQPGLNGGKGKSKGKGSKVKVKGPKKYYYAVAIWNNKDQKFCTEDPPLDIVPGGNIRKKRGSKRSRKARKR